MSAIRSSQVRDYDPEHLSSEGITHVKLDAPVGDVTINCSGTSDFTLTQQKVSEKWNLERDGDTVKVSRNSPSGLSRSTCSDCSPRRTRR